MNSNPAPTEDVGTPDDPPPPAEAPLVNYDDDALVEVTLGEVSYRFDTGKAGTALCISTRDACSWRWQFLGEARWDGRTLRLRALDRSVLEQLSIALREATTGSES
jgi:hypothetical protein